MATVFLFIPNIIGYVRIVLAIMSFYFMPEDYFISAVMYLLSSLLDEFDGHAARYFNQCTQFGAMLDMLTDRCATTALLVMLSVFYQKYMFVFQMLICLDIASHWFHVQRKIYFYPFYGRIFQSEPPLDGNSSLALYFLKYKEVVLFCMCAGNELFFCMLYLVHFTSGPVFSFAGLSVGLWRALVWITMPICVMKQIISLIQLVVACINIARLDENERERANK